MLWDTWKKAFYAWEDSTAKYMEEVLKSPLVLAPSGIMLGGAMKAKAKPTTRRPPAGSATSASRRSAIRSVRSTL